LGFYFHILVYIIFFQRNLLYLWLYVKIFIFLTGNYNFWLIIALLNILFLNKFWRQIFIFTIRTIKFRNFFLLIFFRLRWVFLFILIDIYIRCLFFLFQDNSFIFFIISYTVLTSCVLRLLFLNYLNHKHNMLFHFVTIMYITQIIFLFKIITF
jgi:hypothetical protein